MSYPPSTKLPAPVILCDDAARQYQIRPIPGQQTLFPREPHPADAWLRDMINQHGHNGES